MRDNIKSHIKVIHTELLHCLHPIEFDTVWRDVNEEVSLISHDQYKQQVDKLQRLARQQKQSKSPRDSALHDSEGHHTAHSFFPRVVNLSETSFTADEVHLLDKGLKYAPTTKIKNKDVINLAVHLDAAADGYGLDMKVELSKVLRGNTARHVGNDSRAEQILLNSIKNKLEKDNLIISKADKGNSVVILTRDLYIHKVEKCLENMNLKMLSSDPTKKYYTEINQMINKADKIVSPINKFKIKVNNPSIPVLYGFIKLHKEGNPIRPVASSCQAPAQELSKYLSEVIPDFIDFNSRFSIKNSQDIVDKVIDLRIPHNAKLVSFDVCNLFPSIPVKKLKDILFKDMDSKLDREKAKQLKNLTEACLNQNYFYFNGKIYSQKDGLAMGNSASPFFAEYFMAYLEEKLFKTNDSLIKHVLTWFRYVDDVFCIWTGSARQLDNFLTNVLNKLENGIKFTLELGNNSINFLDLTLTITDNRILFGIYRKDTFADAVIPFSSNHPWNVKMAAFHSMIHRLFIVPLSQEAFNTELKIILNIAKNNDYKKHHIYKLLKNKSRNDALKLLYTRHKNTENPKIWRKVPFIKETESQIKNILEKQEIKPAFFNNKNLNNLLCNNKIKPNVHKYDKSGVYEVKCDDCSAIYIGKTKRTIKTRLKEHIAGAGSKNPQSGLSKHLKENCHKTNLNNVKLIHKQTGGKILNKLEILEIKKAKYVGKNIVNDQIDFTNTSPLLDPKYFI